MQTDLHTYIKLIETTLELEEEIRTYPQGKNNVDSLLEVHTYILSNTILNEIGTERTVFTIHEYLLIKVPSWTVR